MPIRVPSILRAQQSGVEIGRIRLGAKVAMTKRNGDPGERPEKLTEFRLTSASRDAIETAAKLFGGTAQPWKPQGRGPQWEVFTEASELIVVIPPGEAIEQNMELWGKRGDDGVVCLRRCTGGEDEYGAPPINQIDGSACSCPVLDVPRMRAMAADGKACKPTTRARVILPTLPGLGVWRVESKGFYAAVELAGRHDLLRAASEQGKYIPASLRLEPRQKGKQQWGVPVLDVKATPAQIASGEGVGSLPDVLTGRVQAALEAPVRAAIAAAAPTPAPAIGPSTRVEHLPRPEQAQRAANAAMEAETLDGVRKVGIYAKKLDLFDEDVTTSPDDATAIKLGLLLEQRLDELTPVDAV